MKHCLEQKGKPQPVCGQQTVRLSLTGCCPHYLFSAGGFWATVLCPFQVGPGWGSLAPDRFALLLHPVREGGRHPVRPWVTEALGQVEGVINSAAAPGQASRGRWQWVVLKHGGTSPRSLPCPPSEPLGLPGRLSRDRAGRGAGAPGGSSGGREHTWGPEQAGSQRCAGGWYPEGVQAVGGCGEGALGGGAGVRGAAKGKKGWRPCRWGSGGPNEGLQETANSEEVAGGWGGDRARLESWERSPDSIAGVSVQRMTPGKCLGRSPRQWIAPRPES